MGRITRIEGKFMGVPFEVKPTPVNFSKIEDQARNMLKGWYKENYPETYEKLEDEDMDIESLSPEDYENINSWVEDEDFRAEYLKFKATSAMNIKKDLPDDIWKSDELEMSTIEEAWDFFTSRRRVPSGGVQAL